LRTPPTLDAPAAGARLKRLFEDEPPYGARVTFEFEKGGSGWEAPAMAGWLQESAERSSKTWFGKNLSTYGEGGSIPFMGMLGERYPEAQFIITGVLGPYSNAHGPNEFLHVPFAKALTSCMAQILIDERRSASGFR
jgi:acetylornithine deacetylase/succinyl-diaminopimelate desuccinylase-like protein